jgi:hypothetical protein
MTNVAQPNVVFAFYIELTPSDLRASIAHDINLTLPPKTSQTLLPLSAYSNALNLCAALLRFSRTALQQTSDAVKLEINMTMRSRS